MERAMTWPRSQAWGQVCERCQHAGALHRLSPTAPSLDGPYACRSPKCECSVYRHEHLLTSLSRDGFMARFPDWPAPLAEAGLYVQ